MNFNEFQTNVIQWATERQIIQNSSVYNQGLKLLSEYGELCDAVAKQDYECFIDSIGDMAVVAVIICAIEKSEIKLRDDVADFSLQKQDDIIHGIGNYALGAIDSHGRASRCMNIVIDQLQGLALVSEVYFDDCLNAAWHEIKDRTGYMNENGVFIKDESA